MDASSDSVGELARENKDFRRVVATGPHAQVVLMSLRPGAQPRRALPGHAVQADAAAQQEPPVAGSTDAGLRIEVHTHQPSPLHAPPANVFA